MMSSRINMIVLFTTRDSAKKKQVCAKLRQNVSRFGPIGLNATNRSVVKETIQREKEGEFGELDCRVISPLGLSPQQQWLPQQHKQTQNHGMVERIVLPQTAQIQVLHQTSAFIGFQKKETDQLI